MNVAEMENEKRVLTERKSERISYLGREVVFIEAGTSPQEDLQAREDIWSHFFPLLHSSLSLKFKLPLYFRHSHGHADTHQKVNCPGQ